MNKFNKKLLNYDLISIGEQVHGELTSWKFRYNIIKYLTTKCDKVYILCEQLDFFVNGLNNKNVNFIFDDYGFFPCIIYNANKSKEHLYYIKKLIKLLPKIKFYGIDIQIVKFPELYENIDKDLKNIIEKYKKDYLDNDKGSGIIRNKCNAYIINDLMNIINNKSKDINKFVYLAHNEHISFNCNEMRKNKQYLTEGYYLKNILNINYLSIATYSLNIYSIWHCNNIIKNCIIKLIKNKSKKWNDLFKNHEKYIIIDRKYPLKLGMVDYNNMDFDYVICEYFSDNMTLY